MKFHFTAHVYRTCEVCVLTEVISLHFTSTNRKTSWVLCFRNTKISTFIFTRSEGEVKAKWKIAEVKWSVTGLKFHFGTPFHSGVRFTSPTCNQPLSFSNFQILNSIAAFLTQMSAKNDCYKIFSILRRQRINLHLAITECLRKLEKLYRVFSCTSLVLLSFMVVLCKCQYSTIRTKVKKA